MTKTDEKYKCVNLEMKKTHRRQSKLITRPIVAQQKTNFFSNL